LNPRSRNLMGIKNRAQHLFNAVKDHELQKRVAMVSTDVKVDAGEVMVFRNYLDDIGLMIPVSDDQFASFRSDTRSATLRLTSQHVDDAPHIRLALSEPRQEKIFAVFVDEILSALDRKSTRLNSSHVSISYAVFCLKKKRRIANTTCIAHTIRCDTQR